MNIKTSTILLVILSLFQFNKAKVQDVYSGKKTKNEKDISAGFPFESKFINLGTDTVHYVESGEGDPILLLHGLPANAYLW